MVTAGGGTYSGGSVLLHVSHTITRGMRLYRRASWLLPASNAAGTWQAQSAGASSAHNCAMHLPGVTHRRAAGRVHRFGAADTADHVYPVSRAQAAVAVVRRTVGRLPIGFHARQRVRTRAAVLMAGSSMQGRCGVSKQHAAAWERVHFRRVRMQSCGRLLPLCLHHVHEAAARALQALAHGLQARQAAVGAAGAKLSAQAAAHGASVALGTKPSSHVVGRVDAEAPCGMAKCGGRRQLLCEHALACSCSCQHVWAATHCMWNARRHGPMQAISPGPPLGSSQHEHRPLNHVDALWRGALAAHRAA